MHNPGIFLEENIEDRKCYNKSGEKGSSTSQEFSK